MSQQHGRSPPPLSPGGLVPPPYHGHPPMDMVPGGVPLSPPDMRQPYGDQPPQDFDARPPPSEEVLDQAKKETKTLWLGGIPFHYNDMDLRRVFERFGEVVDVKVGYSGGQPLGYCFITFHERDAAEKAFLAVKDGFIGDQPPQEGLSWRVDYDIGKDKKKELGIPPSRGGMRGRFRGGPRRGGGFNNGGRFNNGPPMRRGGYHRGGMHHPPYGGNGGRSPPYNPPPYGMGPMDGPPPSNGPPPYHHHHDPYPPSNYPHNNGRDRPYYGSQQRYEPYSRVPPQGNYNRGGYRGGYRSPPHQDAHPGGSPPHYSGPNDRSGNMGRRDIGHNGPPNNNW
ncbi:predicted protein [Naegleria gruberi]|uniref:Predicted protein n=1 Tax=Naegleria gruberi TaxID=5762 RepID=D2VEI8_NAEGR|nr:uncharacterized protein NAEGRDRAFT_67293 [Naegleria gruberi]EFC44888.1 predicted protein [Naegleria gruberi]|eukprot:XP_002677632.1 predicted protein [Naegleria gruberi strain NEG-M]